MSVVETVLVYVLVPLGALVVLGLLTIAPSLGRRPRYRSGQPWEHAPLWWSGNPDGVGPAHGTGTGQAQLTAAPGTTVGGGARGTW